MGAALARHHQAVSPDAARILAAIATLTLGAIAWLSGIAVQRVGLCTFDVGGFLVDDRDEVVAEVLIQAAEREAIQDEPSLYRAAEIVQRSLLSSFGRGFTGKFCVRCDKIIAGRRVYSARWVGEGTAKDEISALNDLARWALDMGMQASRVGCEVIALHRSVATGRRTQVLPALTALLGGAS